ncbi:ribose-phosphate pyrophosphokinase [Fulvitalea axinellae]|uniref:Ribose-phosphate pyrophosphokinase n=1 Tax=Fulvitalea axinellae TaxID=1182444 RepID=A0AAU9CVQ2_9BACT|nr:ribose-phosphate pyrophosphokinase [Fulvitalea axinellae]
MLDLDKNFRPFPQHEPIAFDSFVFPGGEPHIRIAEGFDTSKTVKVSHRIRSFEDFGFLLMAVDALKRMGVRKIELFLPYFPAARQDRLMCTGEALSAKVYTDILNNLDLENVTVFDPHSDVVPALLDRCRVIDNFAFVKETVARINRPLTLVSPDGGALKKIYKLASRLQGHEVVECSKSRDVKTGKLSGFSVYADDLDGQDCLIVDDICDGGGTFIGLAEELKRKNSGKLYLAVSHGIFSKGTEALTDIFDGVFTTDSFRDLDESSKVEQIKIADLNL